MTLKTARQRRATSPERRAQIHIPHSSWTRTQDHVRSGASLAAEDFWNRLGL